MRIYYVFPYILRAQIQFAIASSIKCNAYVALRPVENDKSKFVRFSEIYKSHFKYATGGAEPPEFVFSLGLGINVSPYYRAFICLFNIQSFKCLETNWSGTW